jgi:hypothetical protein
MLLDDDNDDDLLSQRYCIENNFFQKKDRDIALKITMRVYG